MKKLILLSIIFTIVINAYSQINLVKNWKFQDGTGQPVCMYCFTCKTQNSSCFNKTINADIYDWHNAETADHCPYCSYGFNYNGQVCPTADWIEKGNCPINLEIDGYPSNTFSNRFIGVERNSMYDKHYEGIRSELTQKIQGWTDYIFTFKMAAQAGSAPKNMELIATLSEYKQDWYKNKNNTKVDIDVFKLPANLAHNWYGYRKKFVTYYHNEMQQLVLIRNKDDKDGYLFIDNVELYEYCPNLMPIQNRIFDATDLYDIFMTPLPFEAKIVESGINITPQLPQGPVVCLADSRIHFKGEWAVSMKPGTWVQRGATFRAYIAPCDVVCPIPAPFLRDDTVLCGNTASLPIGGSALPDVTYTWTSETIGALTYLDNPNSNNPIFTPPPTGQGTIKYTVETQNSCGNNYKSSIVIGWDRTPQNNAFFNISNLFTHDSIQFTMTDLAAHTEKIKVQILSCDLNDTIEEFEYNNGIDFTCCTFNFKNTDCLDPCQCYKVRVSSKNYCYENWFSRVFDHTRTSTLDFAILTNAGVCGEDDICFRLVGASRLEFNIFNKQRESIKHVNTSVCGSEVCFTVPTGFPAGTYFPVGTVTGCSSSQDFSSTFAIFCPDDMATAPKTGDKNETLPSNIIAEGTLYEETQVFDAQPFNQIQCLIYPNPTAGTVNLTYNTISQASQVNVTLIDALGRKVLFHNEQKENVGIHNSVILANDLSAGVYTMVITIGNYQKIERLVITDY